MEETKFNQIGVSFKGSGSYVPDQILTNQKKNSSDEFLVEKKSPLVMPPDYSELPLPERNEKNNETEDKKIKSLILSEQDKENSSINNNIEESENFETSILKKIKKN